MLDLRLLASGSLLVISRVSTADRVFISTTQNGSTLGSTLKLVATKKKLSRVRYPDNTSGATNKMWFRNRMMIGIPTEPDEVIDCKCGL